MISLGNYKKVERHIVYLILAEICLQLINAAFMMVLLIYMQKSGYTDYEGAQFTKFRFLSILLFSIPIGYYIRGRKIKPLFYIASFIVPLSSLLIVYSIETKTEWLIYSSQFLWGMGYVCLQIAALPFILRNASKGTLTEGISLSHSTWSIAGMIAGILIFTLHQYNPQIFTEKNLLLFFSVAGFAGLLFIRMIAVEENLNDPENSGDLTETYDWKLIIEAAIPIVLIAVGAGLTIPFISLFFFNVHQLGSETFSLIASLALGLVFAGTLLVPRIKNQLGYKKAVPITQTLAILALVGLACTEMWKGNSFALITAVFFYALRQPLMNMAAPMTSEVTMNYVGKRNQEMMSALTASIWSGSWFISAYLFEIFRSQQMSYMTIFLLTALLYAIGVMAYVWLMRKTE